MENPFLSRRLLSNLFLSPILDSPRQWLSAHQIQGSSCDRFGAIAFIFGILKP